MAEQITLDPPENSAVGRVAVDITPWVKADPGISWGDANVVPYKAAGERGEQVIDTRLENRPIGIPFALKSQGGTSFATIRSLIQGVAARWMTEGGVIRRVTQQGTVYADVPVAGMAQGGNFLQALQRGDTEAELHLEAIPDFYEPEELVAEAEEKTLPELIKAIPDPGGDMPARVRIVVEEKQGADQKGLIWGFRSRYYSSATTARSAYSATELQPLGLAAKEAVAGATGGTALSNTSLTSQWGPIVGTNVGGTGALTHQGTYRVYARLRSPQGAGVSARLVWDVGDLTFPTENSAYTFPAGSAWYVADLGEVRLQAPPVAGNYRWQGQIQAKGAVGGEDINIDRIWLVNEDEGMGVVTAPPGNFSSIVVPVASDNFNATTSGTLTGKVAPLGGTWTGAGDAVGFSVDTTNHWVTRSEKSDADLNTGYYARLGTGTASATEASVDISTTPLFFLEGNTSRAGLFIRYASTSAWLMAVYQTQLPEQPNGKFPIKVMLYKRVSGTVTLVGESAPISSSGTWRSLRVTCDTAGNVKVFDGVQGSSQALVLAATDSALASGGSLESGGYGIYDSYTGSLSSPRLFDNFSVAPTPASDAVCYSLQKAQLTTKGMYRLDSGGTAYGPVSRVIGDLPRLPAGGLENRPAELFVKASRGDLDQIGDSAIDDIAVKVFASRSWLTVPGG